MRIKSWMLQNDSGKNHVCLDVPEPHSCCRTSGPFRLEQSERLHPEALQSRRDSRSQATFPDEVSLPQIAICEHSSSPMLPFQPLLEAYVQPQRAAATHVFHLGSNKLISRYLRIRFVGHAAAAPEQSGVEAPDVTNAHKTPCAFGNRSRPATPSEAAGRLTTSLSPW